ncbi:hypothetical protein JCM19239_5335 [Vibrio variabilis]|uniref:Uncharacterized protein n=1 Tax=Vibrio variabilis TaxID=990271 RepID=A0ABQ0JCL8_9VIBR|nr:hypothetical protein JCM19239_5335 [Vibrio variabilis]
MTASVVHSTCGQFLLDLLLISRAYVLRIEFWYGHDQARSFALRVELQ